MKKQRLPVELFVATVKFSCFHLFIVMLTFGISLAKESNAQELLARPVSINIANQDVRTALLRIGKSVDVKFSYDPALIRNADKISLTARNEPLGQVLNKILNPLRLAYDVSGIYIILTREKAQSTLERRGRVSPLTIPLDIGVSGRVTDANSGNGLPGVNVLIKGTQRGTTTNQNGEYSLEVPNAGSILVFSFVGYEPMEQTVGNRQMLNISMKADEKLLSEVVVMGYGTQKRSDLTGSVSSVKAEEISTLPVRSVSEALQGRAAGVQVTRNSGAPGSGSDIVIRGVGSIGGMSPLYIVDGIRMSSGNNFNLQDVESIEILKDASAAAIYGAQAAGGVVLVTTKRGTSKDKMDISFNTYYGVRKPRNLYQLLNTADYVRAKTAFGVNTSGWGDPATLADNDWVDELYRNAGEQSYSLSLSGATAKTNYYLSANYQREDGTLIDNSFERYGIRSNADFKINKRLKVGETLYAWMTNVNPTQTTTFPYRSAPVVPVRDETNPVGGWAKTGTYFTGPNLVGNEYIRHDKDQQYALEGNIYLDLEIIQGLNVRSTFGASIFNQKNYGFTEAFDFGTLKNLNAFLSRENNTRRNLTANLVLTYDKAIGQHAFKVLAGYESFQSDLSSLYGEAQGFQVITYNLGMTTNPTTYRTSGGEFPQTRLLSQFGRINYTFADKYLLTANIRRDGSDRFGPNNKWGVFPSVSVGWRISEEDFMRDISQVSNLKLRASYGKLGSTSSIPQYTYQNSYGGGGGTNILGLADGSASKGYALTAQLANQNIKWEEVNQADIGLDLGLFQNRLNFTADWYSRQTVDMIYRVPVPASAGFYGSSVYTNIGQMSNKGVELAVDYRGKKGDFSYSVSANAAFNRNLVKQLSGTNNNPINDGDGGPYLESVVARTVAGQPLSQFYGYKVQGIFQSEDEVADLNKTAQEKAAANGGSTKGVFYQASGTGAGDLRFEDTNGDGRITVDDKTFIGNPFPKISYGLTLNLGWKGFDMSALFQGLQGVSIFNANKYYTQFFAGDYNTTGDIFKTSFFDGNGLTDQPRVGYTDAAGKFIRDPNSNYTRISDYAVEDGSFLKLRNLQFGYTIPNTVFKGLAKVRVYLQGQNWLTLTKYSGLDPEVLGRNGTTARGIDSIYGYPRTTFTSVGLSANF